MNIVISGTGVFTPPDQISNEELVSSFNQYVARYNEENKVAISQGDLAPLRESDTDFILKASGIERRYVMDKAGILDIDVMQPLIAPRAAEELSIQVEMALSAAKEALSAADLDGGGIDLVIVAASNLERPYPALAIELQQALGASGFAYDMNVACASVPFAIQAGVAAIRNQNASRVLIVNPEICTAHLNFKDRDSHFIFGDACTALILQQEASLKTQAGFAIIDTVCHTEFSNHIRNNFGFLSKCQPESFRDPRHLFAESQLFTQQGKKVFKEVIPMVSDLIAGQLKRNEVDVNEVKRFWLHQANINMNRLIVAKLLGYEASDGLAPTILQDYANTSSPGCLIAFHYYHADLNPGDMGVICAFGAGYSAGSVLVKKMA